MKVTPIGKYSSLIPGLASTSEFGKERKRTARRPIRLSVRETIPSQSEGVLKGLSGRPQKRLPPAMLKRARKVLLDEARPLSELLTELGFTVRRWDQLVENDQALRDVLDLVRLKEEERIVETLKTSKQHAVTAAIFLAKAKHKYQDQHKPATIETPPSFNVTVMLPAPAKSHEEWSRIIDVTPESIAIEHKVDGE